ncbi:DUF4262 domain-containing protein [Streptomyces sp. NPDC004539]|uniref:DUF4262 domain-containing protein n=1 Tax=Streptomyces sp. NPDC004539 TaxID=3154280 RepID=UPI0033A7C4DB
MFNRDTYLRLVEGIIAREGHAVQYVYGSPGAGARPFAYTIGLHTLPDHDYELAVSGLDDRSSGALLKAVAGVLTDGGTAPVEGLEIDGVLPNRYKIRLRRVSRPHRLGIIQALYDRTPPVWQVLWPDKDHVYPDDGDDRPVREAQPLL